MTVTSDVLEKIFEPFFTTKPQAMPFRFITKSIHAYLIDYPVAIVLMVAPFLLKLGQSDPVALWLSMVTGVAALLQSQQHSPPLWIL
jgi:hypothetical protein